MKKSKKFIEESLSSYNEQVILYSRSWIVSKLQDICYIYHIKCFENIYTYSVSDDNVCHECKKPIPDLISITAKMIEGDV